MNEDHLGYVLSAKNQ